MKFTRWAPQVALLWVCSYLSLESEIIDYCLFLFRGFVTGQSFSENCNLFFVMGKVKLGMWCIIFFFPLELDRVGQCEFKVYGWNLIPMWGQNWFVTATKNIYFSVAAATTQQESHFLHLEWVTHTDSLTLIVCQVKRWRMLSTFKLNYLCFRCLLFLLIYKLLLSFLPY